MNRSLLYTFLIALLLLVQYHLWFSKRGLVDVWRSKKQIAAQTEKNLRLEKINDELHQDVLRLKKGGDVIEEQARSELGMLKPGEVFYRAVEMKLPPRE